ncbi:MAG: MAPEG family protein, partial [Gammaproteobacteria bacterium]
MEGKVLITALYAGILGVIMVLLSLRVIVVARARAHIPYGDGGKDELTPVVRAQGNFAEYVPLALLLIG